MGTTKFCRHSLKAACLWLIMSCMHLSVCAQVTNISGVINSYYEVLEVIPSKACVKLNTVAGLSTVNKVMLVQMKGASINTASASSSTWGDTTSLKYAGNYEFAYICSINIDTVFFVHNLLNSYSAPAGKVQLVTVAEYENATVVDTIKAAPWNSTTGTGGVIALEVTDNLVLNAPIYADSSGYRGGAFFQHSGTCDFFNPTGSNYAYDADNFSSSTNGAHKGEGVADVASNIDGAKGAPANGGGGGNNHNNSGGGGGNLSAGGRGGGNSSSGPASCITSNNMGFGGKALKNWNGTKIFAGGGGGAGHNNNAVFTLGGGNGGGIIFIHAETVTSNGYSISARGGIGGNSQGDGAGGGGAGGTIIMDVISYLDAANISTVGGNGGNSNDVFTPGRCFGGGGGGAGGAIYFRNSTPAGSVITSGGTGGIETQRDAACNTAIPGQPGNNGSVTNNYSYRIGSVFYGTCGIILPTRLIYFKANEEDKKVQLTWKILNPELVEHYSIERSSTNRDWEVINIVQADDINQTYVSTDFQPLSGGNLYRVRITEKNSHTYYTPTRYVFIGSQDAFNVFPNPASDRITILGKFDRPAKLQLVDQAGKVVMNHTLLQNVVELPLPRLPYGVYILRINQNTRKLIIR